MATNKYVIGIEVRRTASSLGVITGIVEAIWNRPNLRLGVYDSIFNKIVYCHLEGNQHEIARRAWGKSVAITGMIKRDIETGRPYEVRQVRHVEIRESSPPGSYKQARGMLAWREGDYSPDSYQRQMLQTWYSHDGSMKSESQILHAALGLAGEAGELADLLKKWAFKPGSTVGQQEVKDELSDVLYYVLIMAHLWGFTTADMVEHLREKLADGHGWKGEPLVVSIQ